MTHAPPSRDKRPPQQVQAQLDGLLSRADSERQTCPRDRLQQAVLHAQRYGEHSGVIFLDLDGFKEVNDSLGHDAGDELLRQVAARLQATVRASDTVARLGGDEFTLLVERLSRAQDAITTADQLLGAVQRPVLLIGKEVSVNASIGISLYPLHGRDGPTLQKQADAAMYTAKRTGKGAVCRWGS